MNPAVHPVTHAKQDDERLGRELLHHPEVNKGTAFTHAERAMLAAPFRHRDTDRVEGRRREGK